MTPISKAALGDCIAACPIASPGCCCCNIFHTHSVRHGVLLPSTGDDACVRPVRQDLKLLVSYRTKRKFPSPPAKDFPRNSAIHTLIRFTVMWSFGRAHGIFVESASAPWSHWVRVVTILSSSSWYKFEIFLIKYCSYFPGHVSTAHTSSTCSSATRSTHETIRIFLMPSRQVRAILGALVRVCKLSDHFCLLNT